VTIGPAVLTIELSFQIVSAWKLQKEEWGILSINGHENLNNSCLSFGENSG